MGILDSVFSGKSGVVATLHNLLGGVAVLKIGVNEFDQETQRGRVLYKSYAVPFLPGGMNLDVQGATAPSLSRSDMRQTQTTLSGTIPTCAVNDDITPERDRILYGGGEYLIVKVARALVGDVDTVYEITAKRVE